MQCICLLKNKTEVIYKFILNQKINVDQHNKKVNILLRNRDDKYNCHFGEFYGSIELYMKSQRLIIYSCVKKKKEY